ncbi:MAG TPA: glycosyltransferase [bacterium]|nr:glycosyltransferase [bacterium]
MRINFIVPGDINTLTGGYIYDKKIINGLTAIGCEVILHQLAGDFPCPDEKSIEECRHLLRALPVNGIVVIDGLVAGVIDGIIKENCKRLRIISLVHLPLSITPWDEQKINRKFFQSERSSLRCSEAVVVSSEFSKTVLLQAEYDIEEEKIYVIEPGLDNIPRKKSYPELPRRLLCAANVIKRKGHLDLLEALAQLKEIDWKLICCGSLEQEISYVQNFRGKIKDYDMEERVILKGAISGKDLESEFLNADLFVFPSRFETYGMALTEAAGYGLPVVTSVDAATNRALPGSATIFYQPDNNAELRKTLFDLMTNAENYLKLCMSAKRQTPAAPSWNQSAEKFYRMLNGINKSKNES